MKNKEKYILNFPIFIFIYIILVGIVIPKNSVLTQFLGFIFFFAAILFNVLFTKARYFVFFYSYLLFCTILILLLSDSYENSFKLFFKFSTSFLIFPVAFSVLNTKDNIKKLFLTLFILSILYIINILFANLFKLGGVKYSDAGLDVGNVFTEGLNSMAYTVIATPVMLFFYPKRKLIILITMTIVFVLVLIQLKRISILAIFLGVFIYLLLNKKRSQAILGVFGVSVIFMLLFPLFENILTKQLESRERKLQTENFENEGRVLEHYWIMSDITETTSKLLFGHNLFNSKGNYKNPFSNERQIHNDYNALLHGSGIIGLSYFLSVQFYLFFLFLKIFKRVKNKMKTHSVENSIVDLFRYLFPAYFFMGLLIMLSGGMYSFLFNMIRYLVLGSILGYLYHQNYQLRNYACVQNNKLL